MIQPREKQAIAAYIKLLANRQVSAVNITKREQFLERLAVVIADITDDGFSYREAVETLLEAIDPADWSFALAVAREYFYFWTANIKAIATLSSSDDFYLGPLQWQPVHADLQSLWQAVDTEKFSVAETWPLKAYMLALRQGGAGQEFVDTRIRLVKVLLVRLKDAPQKDSKFYRLAVDSTVALFSKKETRRLFHAVVREFYYFWIGDPDAEQHILLDDDNSFV